MICFDLCGAETNHSLRKPAGGAVIARRVEPSPPVSKPLSRRLREVTPGAGPSRLSAVVSYAFNPFSTKRRIASLRLLIWFRLAQTSTSASSLTANFTVSATTAVMRGGK
jgi:hypothetical protein